MSKANQLINETSPYLLQHAHNPVNWYPWGEEALTRAKAEDKPILVSIGYSACHWCHVMEKESFENKETADLMNEHFINIKIDREERPDLDHIYMDAVQAMTGSGGWPLNVFLTPEGKPFYGGTYYPPTRAFNRASWTEILDGVSQAFREKRHEIEAQAENLTDHLVQSNGFGLQTPSEAASLLSFSNLERISNNLLVNADKEWGGFGRAPKFPQTFSIQFLLRNAYVNRRTAFKNAGKEIPVENIEDKGLQQALLSLDKMIEGGIYDQVGGGFARYATDTEWLVPHFEKMLYDNALLISVLAEAFQFTGRDRYREVIGETVAFIQRELQYAEGGFYSALDADSEGVEGKFYVWNYDEVVKLLGPDAEMFCEYYDITVKGNWEGVNILRVLRSTEQFALSKNIPTGQLQDLLQRGKEKLFTAREKRVRPGLDDKVLLGWNALFITALCKAFAATGERAYRELAIQSMNFLYQHFRSDKPGSFYHTWKNGQAKYPAFLDDYAYMIQALLHLQEITGDTSWLDRAGESARFVLDQFSEEETGYFYYTGVGQQDVILRKKEVYDGAVPSGNAVMAYNLYQLGLLTDQPAWRERSWKMVASLSNAIVKYPGSFAVWACLLQEMTDGTEEIAILGKDPWKIHDEAMKQYIPHHILMVSNVESRWPLLIGKPLAEKTNIWLCRDYQCKRPVGSIVELMALINREEGRN